MFIEVVAASKMKSLSLVVAFLDLFDLIFWMLLADKKVTDE